MTTTAFIPASQKQIDFVTDLLATRECDADFRAENLRLIEEEQMSKSLASTIIDSLISAPRIKKAASVSPFQQFLAGIPKSKYAVSTDDLVLTDFEDSFKTDIVFLELKEFQGTRYVRRLIGAPGAFSRVRMTLPETKALLDIIARDPYKHARLFGEHYSCCGSCGAELTDARSRELQLGPECRKKFGL